MSVMNVSVLSPHRVLFKGTAKSVIVTGEQGVVEILPFHKRMISRLIPGQLVIDGKKQKIHRGIMKVGQNSVTIIVEGG